MLKRLGVGSLSKNAFLSDSRPVCSSESKYHLWSSGSHTSSSSGDGLCFLLESDLLPETE
jgi:hypothetical protein